MAGLTYKGSGVDVDKAGALKERIKLLARRSFVPGVLRDIGGFGSFFALPSGSYRQPVLVSSTDGVGTKLKIAFLSGRHDTVGIDLVAMNVNDILCTGARPLFFLDYIACGRLAPQVLFTVVKGITAGCVQSGCALIGGETAEMPSFYSAGEYDLAGFCVGVVEKKDIIDGARIRPGDLLVGVASSGLHSNGYSLVHRALSAAQIRRYCRELLVPTRIYVRPVLELLKRLPGAVSGIAHITGGSFYNKVSRILPSGVEAVIRRSSWEVPQIFRLIQDKGRVTEEEMYRTFNMGVGLVLMLRPRSVAGARSLLARHGLKTWVIGRVCRGRKQTVFVE